MIYLTGQLLLFLLFSAFLGFLIGWFTRGALTEVTRIHDLPTLNHGDWPAPAIYHAKSDAADTGTDTDDSTWYISTDAFRR